MVSRPSFLRLTGACRQGRKSHSVTFVNEKPPQHVSVAAAIDWSSFDDSLPVFRATDHGRAHPSGYAPETLICQRRTAAARTVRARLRQRPTDDQSGAEKKSHVTKDGRHGTLQIRLYSF